MPVNKKVCCILAMVLASSALTFLALDSLGKMLLKRGHFPLADQAPDPKTYDIPTFVSRKSALIYEFVPGFSGHYWGTDFSINSGGFRGKELSAPAQDKIRILVMGDSCTFGTGGLEDQETYPQILEKMLNGKSGSERFEVINAGMPGFSVFYGLLLAQEHRLAQLKPDFVIICYGWNDHKPALVEDRRDAFRRSATNFFYRHLTLYRYILLRWAPAEANEVAPRRVLKVNLRQYKHYLSRMVDMFARNNIKVIIMTAPWEPRLFKSGGEWTLESFFLHPRYVELTKEVSFEKKTRLIDLYGLFESQKTADPMDYFNDSFHYNKNGAQLIARKVSEEITQVFTD